MDKITYNILKQKQKTYIKAYAMICAVLLFFGGFYTFQKWRDFSSIEKLIKSNDTYLAALREKVASEKTDYEAAKADFDHLNDEVNLKLGSIFPENDDYTNLTRRIDRIEAELKALGGQFDISSVDYQTPVKDKNYNILPLRMSIRASQSNFTKFLHIVEGSGSLDDNLRLMDISSIRLNFQDADPGAEEIISFTVQINAYFRQ